MLASPHLQGANAALYLCGILVIVAFVIIIIGGLFISRLKGSISVVLFIIGCILPLLFVF